MREQMIGKWRSCSKRTEYTDWEPEREEFIKSIVLNSDGTADYSYASVQNREKPPIPVLWELREPTKLIIYYPVAPMPYADIHEWSREELAFGIDTLTDEEMTLDRNGEILTLFRRIQ